MENLMLPKRQSSSSPSLVAYQRTPSLTTSAGSLRTVLAERGRREREIKKAVAALAKLDDRTLRDIGIPQRSQIEQVGGQNKTGFRAAKRRAAKFIQDAGEIEYRRLQQLGQRKVATEVREQANADAALLESVTQHWFRHMVATKLVRLDPRAAMEQGGWLDYRSVMAYAHDAPAHRRQLVNDMDQTAPTHKHSKARKY
jgi:uncharacterized protein YjiS (DUF1127 family)